MALSMGTALQFICELIKTNERWLLLLVFCLKHKTWINHVMDSLLEVFLIDLFVYKLICRCHISSSITKSKLAFSSAIYQWGNSSPASKVTDYFCFCRLRMKEKCLNLSSCASAVSLTGQVHPWCNSGEVKLRTAFFHFSCWNGVSTEPLFNTWLALQKKNKKPNPFLLNPISPLCVLQSQADIGV